jgi:hypothetical protein
LAPLNLFQDMKLLVQHVLEAQVDRVDLLLRLPERSRDEAGKQRERSPFEGRGDGKRATWRRGEEEEEEGAKGECLFGLLAVVAQPRG